jgi:3-phenylpropionate/trans-cinnamate dioxygenase ferredoxin reductase component
MSEEHFIVIGNGPAGHHAAVMLRLEAPGARITLISKEPHGCYRPHLLPKWIAGSLKEEALYVCPVEEYKKMAIKFRSGQRVVALNPGPKELILDHKEVLRFSGLIIAVGGKPRIPEPLLIFKDVLFTLKTLENARVWREQIPQVESVLIMGGDLTSLAVTKALLSLGKKVFFMVNEEAFWPLRRSLPLFEEMSHRLRQKGVEVLADQRLKGITRKGDRDYEVQVGRQTARVGMIGAFFGLTPDVRFLAGSGLKLDRGVLVDEYLNTGFKGVYATGDCAQIYHPELRDYWVSIGHDNAVELGRTAALNLVGNSVKAETRGKCVFEVQGIRVNSSWWTEF